MDFVPGSDADHQSADETKGSGIGEGLGLVVGVAYHSPLDILAMLPEWLGEVCFVKLPEYNEPNQSVVQIVFGLDRDIRKHGVVVIDSVGDSPMDLSPTKVDGIFRQLFR